MNLDLPKGNRRLDLIEQRDGRYVFGRPGDRSVLDQFTQAFRLPLWILVLLGASGLVCGWYALWPWQVLLILVIVILIAGVVGWTGNWMGSARPHAIVLDTNREAVILPPGGVVEGPLPMRLVRLYVESDSTAEGKGLMKDWWVALEGPVSDQPGEERTFQTRLYGPGFQGDMEMTRMALERLGEWKG